MALREGEQKRRWCINWSKRHCRLVCHVSGNQIPMHSIMLGEVQKWICDDCRSRERTERWYRKNVMPFQKNVPQLGDQFGFEVLKDGTKIPYIPDS
jgi:hypothetical protein